MQTGSGLEVDARQNGLHSRPDAGTDTKYAITKPEYLGMEPDAAVATPPHMSPESRRRIFGLRQSTFVLSVVLAIVLALGITSAALAGHYAMRVGG